MGEPGGTAFIGRARELDRLRAALDQARTGQPATVFIGGEAGVGKSRLIGELLAGADDAFVAIGGSPPGGEGELPFVVVAELLRSVAAQLDPAESDDVLGAARPFIEPLLPGGGTDTAAAGANRTTLFEAILGSVERLGALRGPVILVLEDLHWADQSTRELLAYVVHGLREGRVLVIATYRIDDVPVGHPLRVLLAELDRSPRVARFELARFTTDEVAAQLASLRGSPVAPEVAASIASRTDGNPYFVEELAAEGDPDRVGIPDSVRDLLRSRIVGLPPALDQLLRVCAAYGPEIDSKLIIAIAPMSAHDLGLVLRDGIARGLIVARRAGARESYVFRHALLHEVVYDDMLAVERQRYHYAIASLLEANPDFVSGPRAIAEGLVAYHWLRAAVPARARPALIRAGLAAEHAYAFPEAAVAYEAALSLWDAAEAGDRSGDSSGRRPIGFRPLEAPAQGAAGPDRRDTIRHAATAISLAGRPAAAAAMIRTLLDDAGDPSDWLSLGRYLDLDGDTDGALEAYDRAAHAGPDDTQLVARIAAARARTLAAAGRYGAAKAAATEALGLANRIGSESLTRRARESLGIALAMEGDLDAGLAQLAQARAAPTSRRASVIRPRPSQVGELVRGLADQAAMLERAGRQTEFGATARAGAEVARQLGVAGTLGTTIEVLESRNRFLAGEWDLVDEETRALLTTSLSRADEVRLRLLRAWLDTGRGRFEEAAGELDVARDLLGERDEAALVAELAARDAELAIWRSQLTAAREAVDAGIRRLHEAEDQVAIIGLCWLGIRAEADRAEGDRARRARGDLVESTRVAAALRAEVVALRARLAGRTSSAPRDLRVLATFAEAEWSRLAHPSDPALWAAAVIEAGAIREPLLEAYGQWRQAEAILGGRSARGEAETLVRAAHATATRLGAEALASEVAAVARRARIDLERDAAAAMPADAKPVARETLGLTEREIEVLALVAEGYTNRRIADTLFITEKTAGHHVSNVLGKLGASTRVEAAAIANRLGLVEGVASTITVVTTPRLEPPSITLHERPPRADRPAPKEGDRR